MSRHKSKAWRNTLNVIYGVGAAIVILGALFKLEHFKGASLMLIIGMGVEAVVFLSQHSTSRRTTMSGNVYIPNWTILMQALNLLTQAGENR